MSPKDDGELQQLVRSAIQDFRQKEPKEAYLSVAKLVWKRLGGDLVEDSKVREHIAQCKHESGSNLVYIGKLQVWSRCYWAGTDELCVCPAAGCLQASVNPIQISDGHGEALTQISQQFE